MVDLTLSKQADEDLVSIYAYGYQTHGREQAERYARDLYSRFELLAEFPGMGLPAKIGDLQCLKFPTGRHIIYYLRTDRGILIGRILGAPQDPTRHGLER